MSKKKYNKGSIINNIDTIHMDIDYKKLAEALITAKKEVAKEEFKSKKFRTVGMQLVNIIFYMTLLVVSVFIILCIWKMYCIIHSINLITAIVFTIISIALVIYAVLCHVESFKDSANAIMAHFNTNMSFIALLISFIALLRGVK